MNIDFTIYKAFGLLLCAAFTVAGILSGRARSRQPVEVETDEAEDEDDFYYAASGDGVTVGTLARERK